MFLFNFYPDFKRDQKSHLRVGLPLVATRLIHAIAVFINMMLIARLGANSVAASALIFSTLGMITLIMWSLLYSIAVIVGRFFGAGDVRQVGFALNAGFCLSALIAVPFSLIIWHAQYILLLFHQDQSLVAYTIPYFHVFAFGVLPSLWIVCFDEFVIGILRSRLVVIWTLIISPLNVALGYVLLFGKFGLPSLGIAGIAYANVITNWLLFFAVLIYFFIKADLQKYMFLKLSKACLPYIKKILQISWPITIQLGVVSFAYTFLAYMMGWLGKEALTAHQIATQYVNVAIMIPYGMAQSSAVLIAKALGERRNFVKELGYSGIVLALFFVLLFSLGYWFFPKVLIAGYLNLHDLKNYSSISLAVILLAIVGITQLTDTIGVITTGILRGFHDTRMPMMWAVVTNWLISIPLGYYFACILHLGAPWLYLGFVVGSVCNAIVLLRRFKTITHAFSESASGK